MTLQTSKTLELSTGNLPARTAELFDTPDTLPPDQNSPIWGANMGGCSSCLKRVI